MDVLTEDPTFPDVLGTDLGIDHDANLDNFDLEKFINDYPCMPDEPISAIAYTHPHHAGNSGFRINNLHLRGSSQPGVNPQGGGYCRQEQVRAPAHQSHVINGHVNTSHGGSYNSETQPGLHTTLPDSPPDSEPYSPPDGHVNGQTNGHINGHSSSLQNGHNISHTHMNNPQNTHTESSKYTLTSTPSTMHSHALYTPHHRVPGSAQTPGMMNPVTSGKTSLPPGYHEPPMLNPLTAPGLPVHTHHNPLASMPLPLPAATPTNTGNLSPQNKKRKHMESPSGIYGSRNGLMPSIKQEPNAYTNSSFLPDCDDEYSNFDPDGSNYDNGVYQVIKWEDFQRNKWVALTDANLKDLPAPQYTVDADKGFNFSTSDNSFVCQKKNHFQITCHIGISGDPKYCRTPDGVKKIDHYCLHFYGVKLESQSQTIKVEQSQSDRSKKPFRPVKVDLMPDQVMKMTVGRLHFSETTSNNMRKKGRPNPDQRYFMLVVGLHAHSGENSYMIAASVSGKIIVRASNPGQFDSDMETTHWSKGSVPDSVYHMGCVGVNTDHPDEALTVHGNIKLSGQILHTSDVRAKQDLKEIDSKKQLKTVSGIKLYNYKYSEDYANHVGLPEEKRKDTGVIAQEVQEVLPDAVIDTGDIKFENGEEIKNLLVVNKDRIFMENVGAVKELCKLTDNLEVRIDELEKMNSKLSKLKRLDSLKSTISSRSSCSTSTVASSTTAKKYAYQKPSHQSKSQQQSQLQSNHHKSSNHHHRSKSSSQQAPAPPVSPSNGWCSNRFIQITIIILICVMAFCLIAITILYILERQKDSGNNNTTINNHFHPSGGGSNATSSTLPPHHRASTARIPTTRLPEDPTTSSSYQPVMLVPIPAPCGSTSPPCNKTTCCSRSNDEPDRDLTGFQEFLMDMQRQKEGPYDFPSQGTTDKIQVIIQPSGQFSRDGDLHKMPANKAGTAYRIFRRRRRQIPNLVRDFPAQIGFPELNFTLSDAYLDAVDSMNNNFTFNIPYSEFLDIDTAYILQFIVGSAQKVHLCHRGLGEECGSDNLVDSEWNSVALEWSFKLGKYKSSFWIFRVSDEATENVCDLPGGDEASHVYTQYNLLFARKCSSIS